MDPYVAGVSYTGLTIVGLDWAATAPHRGSARGAPQGSGVWVLGQGPGQMAVERSGDEWFAVRLAPAEPTATSSFAGDLRYDTGLVAYKRRDGSGPWHDVTPLRPRTSLPWDSVGPLLASGGHLGRPVGHDLVLAPDGGVDLVGEWRDPAGVVVRPGELMRVALVGCGVQVQIPAQAGDELEYSVFFRQAPTGGGPGTTSLNRPGPRRDLRRVERPGRGQGAQGRGQGGNHADERAHRRLAHPRFRRDGAADRMGHALRARAAGGEISDRACRSTDWFSPAAPKVGFCCTSSTHRVPALYPILGYPDT